MLLQSARLLAVPLIFVCAPTAMAQCDPSRLPVPGFNEKYRHTVPNEFLWSLGFVPLKNQTKPVVEGRPVETGVTGRLIVGGGTRTFYVVGVNVRSEELFKESLQQLAELGFSSKCRDADNKLLEERVLVRPDGQQLAAMVRKYGSRAPLQQAQRRTQSEEARDTLAKGAPVVREILLGDRSTTADAPPTRTASADARFVCEYKCTNAQLTGSDKTSLSVSVTAASERAALDDTVRHAKQTCYQQTQRVFESGSASCRRQ